MALAPLQLFVDTQARKLKASSTSMADFALPAFVQGEKMRVELTFLVPAVPATVASPYTKLDANGYSAAIQIIAGNPTGTAGGPAALALISGVDWTWDSTNRKFTGQLDLTATAIATAIATNASLACTIEVELLDSDGNRAKYIQQGLTLKASVKEITSTAPSPSETYLTANEIYAIFARYINPAGKTILFKSADGTGSREIGVDNDGIAIDNTGDSG